jgi:superfamily II DNA/RNA helicase
MIIVPTRELALQIDQQMQGISYFTPVTSIAVYGGGDGSTFTQEKTALSKGASIIICTPGKMIAHLVHDYVRLENLKYLVLDEADRMLDMGFFEDIMKIISHLPKERQNLLFAATMPDNIKKLASNVLKDPVEVKIALSKPVEKILQVAYSVHENQKIPLLKRLVEHENLKSVIVFCSTKSSTKQLARELKKGNFAAGEIHSDLDQPERVKILNAFRAKQVKVLVATDVVSRGIDIEDIDLVVNFDVPNDNEDYIHRIGRTARAEADGIAITFVSPREQSYFARIENFLGKPVNKAPVPSDLGEAPEYNPVKKPHFRKRKPGKGPRKR